MDESVILKAARFAQSIHIDQYRTNGDPYFVHPSRVAGMAAAYHRATPMLVALAFLHDVVEDGPEGTTERLEKEFGPELTRMVILISKQKYMTREVTNAKYNEVLATAPFEVKVVKMFDRIDNLRDMKDYPMNKKLRAARETRELTKAIGDADRFLEDMMMSWVSVLEQQAKA